LGYEDKVYGQLHFTREVPVDVQVEVPAEFLAQAEQYGFVIAEDPKRSLIGLSPEAIAVLDADEQGAAWFFNFSETVADADDSDSGRTYNLEGIVESIVKVANADGVSVNGVVIVHGQQSNTDIWRVVVDDNRVRKEKAVISWPDGSVYKG